MKGILKLFPAALAVVALASCSNDDLLDKNGSQAVNGKTMEATIEDFTVMTRAAFAENKDDDGKLTARALVWNAGDSYKVYGELATPDKYTLQNAYDGKKTGTFDLMTDDYNTEPAFAVFPYDKVEADRASKKLTVSLTDWTYATSEVKEDGYNQGGFVSNVPMYGVCDEAGDAAFGYMTSILRVDLSALPKKMTRLIVVTDRPLTGTFETEFDPSSSTYPEIASPVENDEAKESYTFDALTYTNMYFLEIGTESVSKRTNKTFFIAVPTGNKYKVFDILVEYNMGNAKKYELVGQLGNTYRQSKSKSILNWQRGKIKSLTKEITVTASGNTPLAISQFLKDEWKSFPEGDEINITVDLGDGSANATKIVLDGSASDVFTVPAELKNKVINIIATEYAISGGGKLQILDEDPAPVASAALRKINFIVPTADGGTVVINAPETQLEFDGVSDTETATYTSFNPALVAIGDIASESAGLTIGENATVSTSVILDGGSFLSEGVIAGLNNKGDQDILVKNNAANIYSNGNGAVTVAGQLAEDGTIVNTLGTIYARGAGAISVENVISLSIDDDQTKATGAITINNVGTVTKVNVQNTKHNAPVNITKVTTGGVADFSYAGLAAVTIDDVIGGSSTQITCTNDKATGDLKVTNLGTAKDATTGATLALINYVGTGNVTVSGVKNNKDVYPTVTSTTISTSSVHKASNVSFTDVTIGTTGLDKQSTGTLTINGVRAAFGAIKNYQGNVSITGNNVKNANIASLTQEKSGNITLKAISKNLKNDGTIDSPGTLQSLVFSAADGGNTVNYEDTFIDDITNSNAATKPAVTFNGTKSSGIGAINGANAGTNTFTTDTWDGTSFATKASAGVYTSAQLAALQVLNTKTNIALWVSNSTIDLGGNAFQIQYGTGAANLKKGIDGAIVKLEGNKHGTAAKPVPFVIKNLKAESGLFASSATAARTAALEVDYVTLDAPVITATQDAGALIGIANGAVDYTFKAVDVKNATIASASTGKGSDINLGGFIGQVNSTADVMIYGCNVATAAIKGHYYMGGFIGQVVAAKNVKIMALDGGKLDTKGSTVAGITFTPLSADNAWSTLKCGTIAPFIGGIKSITTELNIYGKFDSFDRTANKWNLNFLTNESYKFIGTKEDACNFIGYIDVSTAPAFTYHLKNLNGFEANPEMTILSSTGEGKAWDDILATECNAYAEY